MQSRKNERSHFIRLANPDHTGVYREIYVEIYVPVTNFEIWIYHESW